MVFFSDSIRIKGKVYHYYGTYPNYRKAYNTARWLKKRVRGLNYWIDIRRNVFSSYFRLYTDKARNLF